MKKHRVSVRGLILVVTAFVYTLLYALPHTRFAFGLIRRIWFPHGCDIMILVDIRPFIILMSIILHIILALAVVLLFKKIHGLFIYAYLGSVIASFLLPLFFGLNLGFGYAIIPHANFEWLLDGLVSAIFNLLIGPAMVVLQSYSIMKLIKRKHLKPTIKE